LGEDERDVGAYGPYFQSKRADLYTVFIKHLLAQGLAYPCRMTEAELNAIREQQTQAKQIPGIYGKFSKYRSFTPDELIAKYHQEGDQFQVIRFRAPGDTTKKIVFHDVIKGEISMIDNYNDIVILKGDGLPTYHLAHIVDDTLMRSSLITRGDEWLTSVPLHLQLFKAFELPAPAYAHLAPVSKLDEGKKRKLSKRHDPEANVAFLLEQ
jgi:glutamyl-tRNA synthetase